MHGALGLRLLSGLFALTWLVLPGFGLIDLAVTWSSDWPQVLEAGWGLFFTFFVGAPFVLAAVRPRLSTPAVVQLFVASGALALSALVAREHRLIWFAAAIAVETAIVMWVPGRERLVFGRLREMVSWPLLLLAALGVVPWIVYASRMYALNREELVTADLTIGVDHFSVQGAVGLALAVIVPMAAVWSQGRRFMVCCAGVVAAYLGLVSFAWPEAAGGFDRMWSVAAMAWGIALVLSLAEAIPARRVSSS